MFKPDNIITSLSHHQNIILRPPLHHDSSLMEIYSSILQLAIEVMPRELESNIASNKVSLHTCEGAHVDLAWQKCSKAE